MLVNDGIFKKINTLIKKRNVPHKEIQMGGIGCKVIYEEMRKYLTIYEEAVSHI